MLTPPKIDEYIRELRERVCSRCIVRRQGAPPCEPIGIACGIEQHVPKLVDICHAVHSRRIDPYLDRLAEQICANCKFQDEPICPCPLKYLLTLAVEAIEIVDVRSDGASAPAS